MSNTIGYGAAAIRAGEVKYQQSLVDLMKQAAEKPEKDRTAAAEETAKPADEKVGRNVDIKA